MDKKGNGKCHMKDVPEDKLMLTAAEVLELDEFDEAVFAEDVSLITVPGDFALTFHLADGSEVAKTWVCTAKVDCWTPERRAAWGEYQRNNKNKRWTPEAKKAQSERLKARFAEKPNWNGRKKTDG
jgi:hypothetical protein